MKKPLYLKKLKLYTYCSQRVSGMVDNQETHMAGGTTTTSYAEGLGDRGVKFSDTSRYFLNQSGSAHAGEQLLRLCQSGVGGQVDGAKPAIYGATAAGMTSSPVSVRNSQTKKMLEDTILKKHTARMQDRYADIADYLIDQLPPTTSKKDFIATLEKYRDDKTNGFAKGLELELAAFKKDLMSTEYKDALLADGVPPAQVQPLIDAQCAAANQMLTRKHNEHYNKFKDRLVEEYPSAMSAASGTVIKKGTKVKPDKKLQNAVGAGHSDTGLQLDELEDKAVYDGPNGAKIYQNGDEVKIYPPMSGQLGMKDPFKVKDGEISAYEREVIRKLRGHKGGAFTLDLNNNNALRYDLEGFKKRVKYLIDLENQAREDYNRLHPDKPQMEKIDFMVKGDQTKLESFGKLFPIQDGEKSLIADVFKFFEQEKPPEVKYDSTPAGRKMNKNEEYRKRVKDDARMYAQEPEEFFNKKSKAHPGTARTTVSSPPRRGGPGVRGRVGP